METSKAPYVFFAGPLRNKKVTEVTNGELSWAIRFNREYIETFSNPEATCKWKGSYVTVGTLPVGEADRRVYLAREALEACEKEWRRRHATIREEHGVTPTVGTVNDAFSAVSLCLKQLSDDFSALAHKTQAAANLVKRLEHMLEEVKFNGKP